ncbi:hypothetical protein VMCG_00476 [Cytospora schulzeri]|uniref:Store-operated calcium entry-associated regulatory factor n=1 Tax=Cytospora schulzeri TaxID=448051 RepID=A0A423X7Y7_9PEZI|nr:hypothetical protein VMCG_00476 [Valsa malicola]
MRLLNPISAALAILTLSAEAKPRDAILLSQVESLTLRADRQTTHNRAPAAPQLRCISPSALCALHRVDLMRCENRGAGYDGEDIQWTCTAQLPAELKLGSTDVTCEGYTSPDDPYVLKGSCGVEYRVVLTREGEERWPDLAGGGGETAGGGVAGDWFPVLFWVIFVAVVGYIVYGALTGPGGDGQHRAGNDHFGGGGGGGPGGGDDGWDDPPPPYPGTNDHNNSNNNNRRSQSKRSGRATGQQQGWRPDVRSAGLGAAAGAAAGYGFGRMGNNSSSNNGGRNNNYGSTWGGGNGGEGSSRSNSSTSSSSRYESTGFGSTSRR